MSTSTEQLPDDNAKKYTRDDIVRVAMHSVELLDQALLYLDSCPFCGRAFMYAHELTCVVHEMHMYVHSITEDE